MATRGAADPSSGDYYDPYGERAVLLIAPHGPPVADMPRTLAIEETTVHRRVLARTASGRDLEAIRADLRTVAARFPDALLLHPYDRASVERVVANWTEALGGEQALTGPHNEYVGLEVADYPRLFLGFVLPELMLWETLGELTHAEPARHHTEALKEALEVGGSIVAHLEERARVGRQTYAMTVNTLCALARGSMVYEKRLSLQLVRRAMNGDVG